MATDGSRLASEGFVHRILRAGRSPFDAVGIDPTILAYFRVVFGATMLWYVGRQYTENLVERYYIQPSFHFKFPAFGWVAVPEPWIVHAVFIGIAVAALGILLGAFYRWAAVTFFLLRTYVFLWDQSLFINHEYFACLLGFCLIFVPAHRIFSVDARRRPELRSDVVPAWPLWLLRFQIGTVYFWGGIAKIDADWLAGSFARIALVSRSDLPVVGSFFEEPWLALLIAWGGLLFDVSIPFLLLGRRTWKVAVPLVVMFHLTNFTLFSITFFPWLMIFTTPVFLDPGLLPRVLGRRGTPPILPARPVARPVHRLATVLVLAHVSVQILLPLRQFLFPAHPSWHEEGVRFSWQMMLKDKTGQVRLEVRDLATPESSPIVLVPLAPKSVRESGEPLPDLTLTGPQYRQCAIDPDLLIQLARHTRAVFEAKGHDVSVRVRAEVYLNGRRPPELLVDPTVDLSRAERSFWRHKDVIEPLDEPLPVFGEEWWLEGLRRKIERAKDT